MPLKRKGRIAPRSKKRVAAAFQRSQIRDDVFARDGYRCQFDAFADAWEPEPGLVEEFDRWRSEGCWSHLTPHHLHKSSGGGSYSLENLTTLCVGHNEGVERHPRLALAMGLVIR